MRPQAIWPPWTLVALWNLPSFFFFSVFLMAQRQRESCTTCTLVSFGTKASFWYFSSVAQSCLTLCNPTDCSMPGFPVHHQLPELAQTHPSSQWCHPTISSSVVPFSSCLQSFPASGCFPMSQFSESIGVSASASVLPMNIQDWFPLG